MSMDIYIYVYIYSFWKNKFLGKDESQEKIQWYSMFGNI